MSGQALTGGFREGFPPAHHDKFGGLGRVRGILLCDQSTVQSMSRSGLIGYFKQHISLGSIDSASASCRYLTARMWFFEFMTI